MSGIALRFRRTDDSAPGKPILDAMLEQMAFRGPDGVGRYRSERASLGIRQLATLGHDEASQPLSSSERDIHIAADARIDNRDELADLLGIDADTDDAAVILAAYQRWGRRCPERLIGDFAFVIWDGRENRVFCARDHLGVRSLYYQVDRDTFRCASEIQALFADPAVTRRPHRLAMALFLYELYTENDQTLYDGVFAVPGAHHLTVSSAGVQLERYWQPDPWFRLESASDAAYAERFGDTFREAVRCRMRSHTPLAMHVSGGLDSSSVTVQAEALRSGGPEPMLLRTVFPGLECDESRYSDAVAKSCGLPLSSFDALANTELARPVADASHPDLYFNPAVNLHTPMLRAAQAKGARSVLTGLGGDEMMRATGFECADDLRAGRIRKVMRTTGLMKRPLSGSSWATVMQHGRQLIPERTRARFRPLRRRRSLWPGWLASDLGEELTEYQYARERRRAEVRYPDLVTRNLCETLDSRHVKFPLAVEGRLAAARGMEFRHPFYDKRVVELLLAMPHAQRVRGPWVKPVLRRAMSKLLPEVVRNRTDDAAFLCYLKRAFFDRFGSQLRELFQDSHLAKAGIIDSQRVRRSLDEVSAPRLLGRQVYLTGLELWLRNVTN
ncbi:hypothetical protein JYT22_00060 [Endomicrobium sp. AH-315-J14]|nr:hypothetical protein [Endomicrobium sp. AH-315-J14]